MRQKWAPIIQIVLVVAIYIPRGELVAQMAPCNRAEAELEPKFQLFLSL